MDEAYCVKNVPSAHPLDGLGWAKVNLEQVSRARVEVPVYRIKQEQGNKTRVTRWPLD